MFENPAQAKYYLKKEKNYEMLYTNASKKNRLILFVN